MEGRYLVKEQIVPIVRQLAHHHCRLCLY